MSTALDLRRSSKVAPIVTSVSRQDQSHPAASKPVSTREVPPPPSLPGHRPPESPDPKPATVLSRHGSNIDDSNPSSPSRPAPAAVVAPAGGGEEALVPTAVLQEVLDVLRSKPWESRRPHPHRLPRHSTPAPAVAGGDPGAGSGGEHCCGGGWVESLERSWWYPLIGFKATILPRIWSQVALTAACSAIAVELHSAQGLSCDATAHELTGIVLGFLLGFRVESCATRFQEGEEAVGQMAAALEEFGHLVTTAVSIPPGSLEPRLLPRIAITRKDVGLEDDECGAYFDPLPEEEKIAWALRKDLLRLSTVLLGMGCRDLQKGSLAAGERLHEVAQHTEAFYKLCQLTGAEKTALKACSRVTDGAGEFGVQLVTTWLTNMLQDAVRAGTLHMDALEALLERLASFRAAYCKARSLSYKEAPYQYSHMFVLLVSVFCFSAPFAMVESFGAFVHLPAAVIAVAFFGLYEISRDMEKPYGFDSHDIRVEAMVQSLHDKYRATTRLALTGRFQERPASTGGDVLAALLRKEEGGAGMSPSGPILVPSYSLCRLPSIISSDPDRGGYQRPTPPTSMPAFSLNEKSKSDVTSNSAATHGSSSASLESPAAGVGVLHGGPPQQQQPGRPQDGGGKMLQVE